MTARPTFIVVVVLAVCAGGAAWFLLRRPAVAAPDGGVPRALADARAARVSDLRYEVTFRVPAARREPIGAHLRASFRLADARDPLAFDFAQPIDRLLAMHANTRILEPRVDNGHILIPPAALVEGDNVVEFEFVAGEAPLNRQDEFLYALFVPARASETMPVFDQPDLKARWRLILNIPKDWTAVANGPEVGRVDGADHLGLVFELAQPISTYLFTFAAGRFSVDTDTRDGREFRLLHRETDAAKFARNRGAIYDLHARALSWLEAYTGITYPFDKFDAVLIPSFQFGGMEHPGAIFYNAASLLLDPSATQGQLLGRASLIAHETAHMWFGNLVTMRWFNDVWMKEVFANFMAAKIVNPSFPEVNHDLRFLFQHYPAAYDVDRTEGANPIRQDLANLNEAGSLYGAIIYQKAPIAMRQLELTIGEEVFRDGVREYLAVHRFGNASWADLIAILDRRTAHDLAAWSRAWIESRGRPRIHVRVDRTATPPAVTLTPEDPLGRSLEWPQRLTLAVARRTRVEFVDVAAGPPRVVTLAGGEPVAWVLPTGRGLGYGDFVLEPADLDALALAVPEMADALTRGAALVTLWESMLEGRLPTSRLRETLVATLGRKVDELTLAQLLGYLRDLFWRFTAADDRAALAPAVESVLRAGLARAATATQAAAWFGALRQIATTPETVSWLARVWAREIRVPHLTLAESDEADLALELAVRGVPNAAAMLDEQTARFRNPDRRARFEFVRPAVAADAATREAFFARLRDVEQRRREAWVLEAARYLHHPLRAAASRRLVPDALGLVREIQQTGDIFFPKRWADATLWGYQSPQTAAEVRRFIDTLPDDYPPRLRWVLLSAADPLFRAARSLHQ